MTVCPTYAVGEMWKHSEIWWLELHHIGAQTVYFEYTGGKPNHPCQKGGILNGEREKWEQEVKTYILPSVVILL